MLRSKNIIYISHCILNQNTVVEPLARSTGGYNKIIKKILDSGIGIEQLRCPEMIYAGMNRKPMTKEEYDTEEFNEICTKLASKVKKEVKHFEKNGYNILGVIGIKDSPTCAITSNRGIFMEILLDMIPYFEYNFWEVPTDYVENGLEKNTRFAEILETQINEKWHFQQSKK